VQTRRRCNGPRILRRTKGSRPTRSRALSTCWRVPHSAVIRILTIRRARPFRSVRTGSRSSRLPSTRVLIATAANWVAWIDMPSSVNQQAPLTKGATLRGESENVRWKRSIEPLCEADGQCWHIIGETSSRSIGHFRQVLAAALSTRRAQNSLSEMFGSTNRIRT
jgi:hypothetical protein